MVVGGIQRRRSGKSIINVDYFDDYDTNAACDDNGDGGDDDYGGGW